MANIYDPNGALGQTASANSCIQIPFKATAVAIAAKKWVAINTTGEIAIQATDGTDVLGIGVTMDAIPASGTGMVAVYGLVTGMNTQGAISAGDILKVSGTTDGNLSATATPAQAEAMGFAVTASTANVADVFIKCVGDT
jgi:hypothetical protein